MKNFPQQESGFNPSDAILTNKDSRARTDEKFLRAAESRGTEEVTRKNEERPIPINEMGHDLLPHDVAEDLGIDKDSDPEGDFYWDGEELQRGVAVNGFNDIGEFIDDEETEDPEEPEEKPILTDKTLAFRAAEARRKQAEKKFDHYYKEYEDFESEEAEEAEQQEVAADGEQLPPQSRIWRDHIPEHPVNAYIWHESTSEEEALAAEQEQEIESALIKKDVNEAKKRFNNAEYGVKTEDMKYGKPPENTPLYKNEYKVPVKRLADFQEKLASKDNSKTDSLENVNPDLDKPDSYEDLDVYGPGKTMTY